MLLLLPAASAAFHLHAAMPPGTYTKFGYLVATHIEYYCYYCYYCYF